MFSKILVANRGEVAVRIIRACREMGVQTVAVYSEADENALHAALADERVCIGPPRAAESYLKIENIISAALSIGARAIHPGYGFLAENADFAAACAEYGLVFIGPSPEVITAMGDKNNARESAKAAGVPVVPGSGIIQSGAQALAEAERIGYPLLVKATAGGGGKGIREADSPEMLTEALKVASLEAEKAFGNGAVYLERKLTNVRHVEVQILADSHGNVAALGERDCSLQRNKQKLIEETPSPAVTPLLRQRMQEAAVRAAKSAGYVGAGTVEFLLTPEGEFYFIEMNTRLQVEHQITEEVTGVDIVKWQLRIACGMALPAEMLTVRPAGCSIECRVNALQAGKIGLFHAPAGYRSHFSSALLPGGEVTPYYDAMLGKMIVWAPDREEAIRKMDAALCEIIVDGVSTNIESQLDIVRSEGFRRGDYHTLWLQNGENCP